MDSNAFVINLDRDVSKWEAVAGRLRDQGIRFERLPAVDGRQLQDVSAHCTPACAWFCPRAAVGCFLSHKRAWQTVVDRGLSEALVFEDDVAFEPHARQLVEAAQRELPADYHVMLLGCFTCEDEMWVEHLLGLARGLASARTVSAHLAVPSQTFGSQAYLVSNAGARMLLSLLSRMSTTVDWQMGSAMKQGLRVFTTLPGATYQASMESSSIATRAPALLNLAFNNVPADRHRSVGWVLSVPLLSLGGFDLSAWSLLLCFLACLFPRVACALTAVDCAVGCCCLGSTPRDYVPTAAAVTVGGLLSSAARIYF